MVEYFALVFVCLFVCFFLLKRKDVPVVEFLYRVFTRVPGESYCRRLGSLLLYLCYVFRALIKLSCVLIFFFSFFVVVVVVVFLSGRPPLATTGRFFCTRVFSVQKEISGHE